MTAWVQYYVRIIMNRFFEAAVIGLGPMGSAVALWPARSKASVTGFDRFWPSHRIAGQGGGMRVFRVAYSELMDYAPLARCTETLWDCLEGETCTHLLTLCGLLTMGGCQVSPAHTQAPPCIEALCGALGNRTVTRSRKAKTRQTLPIASL
jgi:hypothetical protein